MQTKKLSTALIIMAALLLLAGLAGQVVTANPNAQATAASTGAATAPALPTATPRPLAAVKLDIPGSGLIKGTVDGEATRLNEDGATFPLPLYQAWAPLYKQATGVEISFNGGGSGQGKKDISSMAVDVAGSDSFMTDQDLAGAKGGTIVQVPTCVGGIVPVYNVKELQGKDPLKLTGANLASIYLGEITKWNDPKLVADNPDLKDVDQDIAVVHRSDGSGTTQNFTAYLSFVSKTWADKVKSGTTVNWPVGIGASGNPGVAQEVKQDDYSLGYVELAYAMDMQSALVQNGNGKFVAATPDTISASMAGVTVPDDLRVTLIGKSSKDAYPIVTMTWLLAYTNQKDAGKGVALARFLWWATHDGQQYNASQGYAPLPVEIIKKAEANILKIQVNGKQALPAGIASK